MEGEQNMPVKLKSGKLTKSYSNDGGFDIEVKEDVIIGIDELVVIDTDISFSEIPKGYCIEVLGRSSTVFVNSLFVPTTIVDAGYTGCISYAVINMSNSSFKLRKGDRVAQLVIVKIEDEVIEDGGEVCIRNAGKERGDCRVGSSGM